DRTTFPTMSDGAFQFLQESPADAATAAALPQVGGTDEAPPIPSTLSILPVRGFVVFPHTLSPLNVRRPFSLQLLNDTLPQNKIIGLVAQRDETKDEPEISDLYPVGTAAMVLKVLRQSDRHLVVIAQGLRRFAIRKITQTAPYLRAEVEVLNTLPAP